MLVVHCNLVFPFCLLSLVTIILHLILVLQHYSYLTCMSIAVLPVMLSSKLLPEMEVEETTKRELLLSGIANIPVPSQIEKLKVINAVRRMQTYVTLLLIDLLAVC